MRFCGIHGGDKANNDLMLRKLENVIDRCAYYVCAIALACPDGKTITAEGYLHGEIGFEEKGEQKLLIHTARSSAEMTAVMSG